MFDVLAPGKLVLTLRSTPPFVAESAFALALTILLAAPLIVRVYLLLDRPLRAFTKTSSSRRHARACSRSLLIHYPARVEVADSTSSSSLHTEYVRGRINSTPTLRDDGDVSRSSSRRGIRVDDGRRIGDRGSNEVRKCPPADRPTFPADSRRRIIDMSSLDYKAYRHKLIEATLRRQYDDFQPPGDVVLNSLHLSSADSVIGVRLNDRYDHSLFDFVEEYYDVAAATSRRNVARPHPLNYFLSKGARRPRTSEKETETIPNDGADRENSRNHLWENVDGNPPKLPGVDDNGNPCVRAPPDDVLAITTSNRDSRSRVPILKKSFPTRSRNRADEGPTLGHNVVDDCPQSAGLRTRKESSWTGNDRPASARGRNTSKIFSLSRAATSLDGRREATGTPRKKKLEDYPPTVSPLMSSDKRRAEREASGIRLNFISVSSSEIASIRSDSSKRREDEASWRSRESSISPRSHASSRPPWMSGNRGTSFNRKYGGNVTEFSAARVAGPRSARGSFPPRQKLAEVSSRERSKESSTGHNPALSGRRAASFVGASPGKEFIGMTVEQQSGEDPATRPPRHGQWSIKSKDVEGVAVEDNEEGRTLETTDLPGGEKMPASCSTTSPDNAALSFLSSPARTPARPRRRTSRTAYPAADAPVTTSETSATKEKPELITSRSGTDDAARGGPVPGNNAPGLFPPSVQRDRRESPAKLNRGGRRRLRSAENPSKGASLSPQIELSAEVLNPADDTDKSAIPDGEKLAGLTCRIDPPPREDTGTAGRSDGNRATGSARTRAAAGNDMKSNSANDVARSRILKIIRDLRARPASANNLLRSRGPAAAPHPARRDANSETKSGLNGTKLNTRSNGAVDEMRYDESPSAEAAAAATSLAPRECGSVSAEKAEETRRRWGDIARGRGVDEEELQLPRHDSKIGLAMNSALKRYIKMLKQGLLNRDRDGGVALMASLSLSDAVAVLSDHQGTPLSPEEVQELQIVLDRIERNPELLCKLSSCPSVESVV
ncbi:PREDICTED: uncharacterized protein LOC105453036 [Wasmannia auropunctata]|uniref:uncharacterized protein LOC105453036 n=1 Tax=Wasmannia auropunctata TaxID=64793 RepID=UPI0005EF9738|nr:PREDICTED: uncharacterized protein LOC105453036 [Wasmannia auropunctata]